MHRAFGWAAVLGGLMIVAGELWRWSDPQRRLFALFGILSGEQPDWLPFLPLFALLPWLWWRFPVRTIPPTLPKSAPRDGPASAWMATIFVGGLAGLASHNLNQEFTSSDGRVFPPAYHDEYSYLLQAETFRQGRSWLPTPGPRAELYNQMHVLNEGHFASRYFPGTGAWLAAFTFWSDPWRAQQAAHALCAMLVFWIGRDLRGNLSGLVSGVLFALSPGLLIFSTLLLAHHATLLGLMVFVWAFLRLKRRLTSTVDARVPPAGNKVVAYALLAGAGLAFAMLCRPMTAAGVGLPFGLWFAFWLVTGRAVRDGRLAISPVSATDSIETVKAAIGFRCAVAALLVAPLPLGLGGLVWYSQSITGDPWRSPYQRYTDIYTPRHVYGFNNVVRGEQRLGPKVVDNYDRWAENLTPTLAAKNVVTRIVGSLRLTLGAVPLVFALLFLVLGRRLTGSVLLLAAAIVSLHLVHIPYWYAGIMDWHYVMESAPFWLLLCGVATSELAVWSRRVGSGWPRYCWGGVITTAVAVNTFTVPLLQSAEGDWYLWRGRLPALIPEFRFARGIYAHVADEIERLRSGAPALVLVLPDPTDRSLDFVTNRPSQWDTVLRVRVPLDEQSPDALRRIAALFPHRRPLVLTAATREVQPLPSTVGRRE